MATWIVPDLCINCGACEPVCPNSAITDGSDVDESLSKGVYYIKPELCTECVGENGAEQCQEVCPVECCLPNPEIVESEEILAARAIALHPDDQDLKARIESGNFPSLKRK
jgi:ferredoxin